MGLSFSYDELPYKWSIIEPFIRPFSIRIHFAYESFCLDVKLLTTMSTRSYCKYSTKKSFFSTFNPWHQFLALWLSPRSREFVGNQGAIPFSPDRFFHYFKWWVYWSFFHNLFNYGFGRRGLVLFFHYLSLDEKSFAFSIPCLFLSWLIAGGNEWDQRIKCPLWKASLPSL